MEFRPQSAGEPGSPTGLCRRRPAPVAARFAALLFLLASPVSWAVDYAALVSAWQPTAYWRLNETAPVPTANRAWNYSTNGWDFDGFYNGNAYHPVRGVLVASADGAAAFDGSPGSWISLPNFPALNPTNAFTVECWVQPAIARPDDNDVATPFASIHRTSTQARGWIFYQMASGWNFRLGNRNGYIANVTSSTLPRAGTWAHLVATYDGVTVALYINGQLEASATTPARYDPNLTQPISIGGRADDTFRFNGLVDEVTIFPRALTAAEIQGHFANAASPGPSPAYPQLILSQNPAGYYRLDEPAYSAGAEPIARNFGIAGTSLDGRYAAGTTNAVEGPRPNTFSGFASDNRAIDLCGAGGYVRTPAQLTLMPRFTLLGWARRGDVHSGRGSLFGQAGIIEVAEADNGDLLEIKVAAYGTSLRLPYPFPAGVWGMLAIVADGTRVVAYTNGVAAGSLPGNVANYGTGTGTFNIGGGVSATPGDWFRGRLDEVAVIPRALAAGDVQQLYEYAGIAPFIAVQPAAPPGPIFAGNIVTLSVTAVGTPTLNYRWYKGNALIQSQTGPSLTLNPAVTNNTGLYRAVVFNDYGAVTSSIVELNIQPAHAPVVTAPPIPRTRFAGSSATFGVTAAGTPPLSYQWQFNGADIPGQVGPTLSLVNLNPSADGDYRVIVKNLIAPLGVASPPAHLSVLSPSRYAATVLSDNPLAYWPLGETNGLIANDAWHGYDGAYANVTLGQPGYSAGDPNAAARFAPEQDSRVVVEESGDLDFNGYSIDCLIEAWVKPRAVSGLQRICSNRRTPASAEGGYGFGLDGADKLRFSAFGSIEIYSPPIDPPLIPGKWYHLAVVVESSQVTFYVNGQPLGTAYPLLNGITSSPEPFQLGRNPVTTFGEEELDGILDEVAVFDRALPPARVKAHYDARDDGSLLPVFSLQPQATRVYAGRPFTLTAIAEGSARVRYQWLVNNGVVTGATNETFTGSGIAGTYTVQCFAANAKGSVGSEKATLTIDPLPTTSDLSGDLVVHLRLDGSASDTSGRGNHGTNVNQAGYIVGKLGPAALSPLSNPDVIPKVFRYVTLGKPHDLDFGTDTSFSVAFWTRFSNLQGPVPWIANNLSSLGDAGIALVPSPGSWSWSVNDSINPRLDGGISAIDSTLNRLTDNNWHHLAFTFDRAGDAVTYLDGVRVNTTSLRPAIGWNLTTGRAWTVGQAGGAYPAAADFAVDDVGIWRRALSAYDVDTMYLVGQRLGLSFAADQPARYEMSIGKLGGSILLQWNGPGILQSAPSPVGPWSAIPQAISPHTATPSTTRQYYRVHD